MTEDTPIEPLPGEGPPQAVPPAASTPPPPSGTGVPVAADAVLGSAAVPALAAATSIAVEVAVSGTVRFAGVGNIAASVIDVGNQASPQMVFFGVEHQAGDLSTFVVPIELLCGYFFLVIALTMVGPGQQLGRALRPREADTGGEQLDAGALALAGADLVDALEDPLDVDVGRLQRRVERARAQQDRHRPAAVFLSVLWVDGAVHSAGGGPLWV